jgi:hypothetical protein
LFWENYRNEEEVMMLEGMGYIKGLYLQRSANKLLESVNKLFLNNTIPTYEDINNWVSSFGNEIEFSKISHNSLSLPLIRNVIRAIKMFAVKIEQLVGWNNFFW